jgi:hypothetical protein
LACCASAAVASKVCGLSLGSPKMNEPSTCTPRFLNSCSRSASASPARLKSLYTSLRPSGVTDSMPTSAPRMRALRIASRYSGSSAASIVICVKKFMSDGSFDICSISSNRSSRIPFSRL